MKKLLIYAHNRDGRHIDLKTIQLPRENLDYQWIERHLGGESNASDSVYADR